MSTTQQPPTVEGIQQQLQGAYDTSKQIVINYIESVKLRQAAELNNAFNALGHTLEQQAKELFIFREFEQKLRHQLLADEDGVKMFMDRLAALRQEQVKELEAAKKRAVAQTSKS